MKFDEKMFANMREAMQKILTSGPMAATVAIQQALQKGVGHDAWDTPQPRPLRDINPVPETELTEVGNLALKNDFVSGLLAQLGIPSHLEGGQFVQPEFASPEFLTPSLRPQLPQQVATDAGSPGRFIAASYSNRAGSRAYKLYIPSCHHGQALPLMVMLHGCTQNPDNFAAGTRMNAIAEEQRCFVAYPAQAQSANSSKCWNWFKAIDQQRDQGEPSIIAGITRQIIDTQNIDTSQVYIAGMSAGGAMAVVMGTLYPDLYAAVGVHSGLPYASAHDLPSALAAMRDGAPGQPPRNGSSAAASTRLNAIPIIVFHGDSDTTVHPRNGEKVIAQSAPQTAHQRLRHQDPPAASAATPLKPAPSVRRGKIPNGHAYTQTTHHNAEGQAVAEHWLIHGAAHAWSGGSQRGSYTDAKGPDASREMIRFFYTQVKKPALDRSGTALTP
ncbi:alpha/beta hydrolase family esterase [Paraherbaspirillum soli]|uniref:Alpha/beta hydrolase family esterase n=1 Tax=Paraherbaspirillum soli TaxID=631222 RepID=A0ABW0M3S6_9BURK